MLLTSGKYYISKRGEFGGVRANCRCRKYRHFGKNSTEIGEDSTVQKSPHGNRIKFRPIHVGINFYISKKLFVNIGQNVLGVGAENLTDAPSLSEAAARCAGECAVEYLGDAVDAAVAHVVGESVADVVSALYRLGRVVVHLAVCRNVAAHRECPTRAHVIGAVAVDELADILGFVFGVGGGERAQTVGGVEVLAHAVDDGGFFLAIEHGVGE